MSVILFQGITSIYIETALLVYYSTGLIAMSSDTRAGFRGLIQEKFVLSEDRDQSNIYTQYYMALI